MVSCPWAARSRVALAEANADFEEIEIDLRNKPEWYLKVNPVAHASTLYLTIRMGKFPL
jgi:glutathione S-transferase